MTREILSQIIRGKACTPEEATWTMLLKGQVRDAEYDLPLPETEAQGQQARQLLFGGITSGPSERRQGIHKKRCRARVPRRGA